jgi:general secretion pathway protein G
MNRTNKKNTRYSIHDARDVFYAGDERREARRGFTIIEVMAVILIIGILGSIVAVNVVGRIDKAKVTSTKANLKVLHNAVIQFKLDTGRYPTEEAGLQELVEQPSDVTGWNTGGYLETTTLPKDAWGTEFVYQLSPDSGKPFVIISYGADGEEGGEKLDADLYSTDTD